MWSLRHENAGRSGPPLPISGPRPGRKSWAGSACGGKQVALEGRPARPGLARRHFRAGRLISHLLSARQTALRLLICILLLGDTSARPAGVRTAGAVGGRAREFKLERNKWPGRIRPHLEPELCRPSKHSLRPDISRGRLAPMGATCLISAGCLECLLAPLKLYEGSQVINLSSLRAGHLLLG